MSIKFEDDRLREIEQAQASLRASIEDTRRLSEKTQQLLEKRRAPLSDGRE
ncbi:hypothetical protein [Allosphingosinicella sp.]|uniref:hypothetical protein n=1 Tax=Allosphingosinicella sp. TaxID=2823234 RepID=UPI002FC0B3E9